MAAEAIPESKVVPRPLVYLVAVGFVFLALLLSGDPMGARAAYGRALDADPTYAKARVNLAALLLASALIAQEMSAASYIAIPAEVLEAYQLLQDIAR